MIFMPHHFVRADVILLLQNCSLEEKPLVQPREFSSRLRQSRVTRVALTVLHENQLAGQEIPATFKSLSAFG